MKITEEEIKDLIRIKKEVGDYADIMQERYEEENVKFFDYDEGAMSRESLDELFWASANLKSILENSDSLEGK